MIKTTLLNYDETKNTTTWRVELDDAKRLKSFFFLSHPIEKIVERLGYEVTFNPLGDVDCFYASAAKAFGIETQSLKKVVYDFPRMNIL